MSERIGIVYTYTPQDRSVYDYQFLAWQAGERAASILQIPYEVIRVEPWENERVRTNDDGKIGPMLNSNMVEGIRQSPFDITLFMDSDFIVNTDALGLELQVMQNQPRAAVRFMTNDNVKHVGKPAYNPCTLWSTVLIWRKSKAMDQFWETVLRYAENWDYVLSVENLPSMVFRNDIAWSLARSSVWPDTSLKSQSMSESYQAYFARVPYDPVERKLQGQPNRIQLDIHAMHKTSLIEGWRRSMDKEEKIDEAGSGEV